MASPWWGQSICMRSWNQSASWIPTWLERGAAAPQGFGCSEKMADPSTTPPRKAVRRRKYRLVVVHLRKGFLHGIMFFARFFPYLFERGKVHCGDDGSCNDVEPGG